MHIKIEKNAIIYVALGWFCLGIVCILMYFIAKAPLAFSLFLFFIPSALCIFPFAMATCREIMMDNNGCKVRYIFFTRYYKWEDIVTCRLEKYSRVTYKSPYDSAVIFSAHRIWKPRWMKPLEYVFIAPPGSFFFVHFMPENRELYDSKINGFPLLCCIDKQEFLSRMSEWNIPIQE